MNITVIGRGRVGGGLARMWEKAGHEVRTLGRDGGAASDADVVVVAVPGNSIGEALQGVMEDRKIEIAIYSTVLGRFV